MILRRRWSAALATLLAAGTLAAIPPAAQAAAAGDAPAKVVTAYFASWDVYGRQYFVKDIPADKLNVIQYAFGAPTFDAATGTVGCNTLDPWADYQMVYWSGDNTVDGVADLYPNQRLYGNFNQLRKLKARNPHLKVQISLGGWTKSTWFSSVAATAERREAFVKACVDTFLRGNLPTGGWPENAGGIGAAAGLFDGIDIDWEYPTQKADGNIGYGPADRKNATLLFQEFRRQINALSAEHHKKYLLTAAFPASKKASEYYELKAAVSTLDWVNVMTYDFNVPGGTKTGHNTLMLPDPRDPHAGDLTWNTTGTVAHYLLNGVPANKIVVGVPFYGNQYLRTNGLYAAHDSTGLDPESLNWQTKPQPSYHDLVDVGKIVGQNGFTRTWNWLAGEPYLYNPATRNLIVYSDKQSIALRTTLVQLAGLRGVMAWELSQDSDNDTLMSQLATILPPGSTTPPAPPAPKVVSKVATADRVFFLTIDDGWVTPEDGAALLRDSNFPVTMFLLPQAAQNNTAYFRQFRGNVQDHSVTHADLSQLTLEAQQKEICDARDLNAALFTPAPTLFRPPYGTYNADTLKAAQNCSMKALVTWSVIADNGQLSSNLQAGDIVLLHFTGNLKADLDAVLASAAAAGLTPALLTDYLA